jgi:hypothetical protein
LRFHALPLLAFLAPYFFAVASICIYTTSRRKPRKGRIGQAEKDIQNRLGRTEHPERDRQNGTGITGQA